jgi:hypothetical protein
MRSVHALAFSVLAAAFALSAQAAGNTANDGYWVDKEGKPLKSMTTGVCFRSTRWSEAKADPACKEALRKEKMASQARK